MFNIKKFFEKGRKENREQKPQRFEVSISIIDGKPYVSSNTEGKPFRILMEAKEVDPRDLDASVQRFEEGGTIILDSTKMSKRKFLEITKLEGIEFNDEELEDTFSSITERYSKEQIEKLLERVEEEIEQEQKRYESLKGIKMSSPENVSEKRKQLEAQGKDMEHLIREKLLLQFALQKKMEEGSQEKKEGE